MTHPHRPDRLRSAARCTPGWVGAACSPSRSACVFLAGLDPRSPLLAPAARRVVFVLATDVDWTLVTPGETPTLYDLMRRGTLANVVAKRQLGEGSRSRYHLRPL